MAAPLKRVCRQAAQNKPLRSYLSLPRASFAGSVQCHSTALSRRLYNTTSRNQASEELVENDLDQYLEALDENLPDESDLASAAHEQLDQHRDLRELVRLAAWEMPFLAQHAKEAEPSEYHKKLPARRVRPHNDVENPLRWRYTTYLAEMHPASRKVVVEFEVKTLGRSYLPTASKEERKKKMDKLRKLAGVRYNPETDIVHMSCESFMTQAQNKRYLADTITELLAEANNMEDSFEDVPLDTRHHKFKKRLVFPEEWKLTPERKAALEEQRKTLSLEETRKIEAGRIIDGAAAIEHARQIVAKRAEEKVAQEVKTPLPSARKGQKRLGMN